MRNSWADLSPDVDPDPLRFLLHVPLLRRLTIRVSILGVITLGCFIACVIIRGPEGNWYEPLPLHLFATLCGFVTIVAVLDLHVWYKAEAYLYTNALLCPAVVLPGEPLAMAVLASLRNGHHGPKVDGLRRITLKSPIPLQHREPGTRIPVVSRFQRGRGLDRWVYFISMPISWGTGKDYKIEDCLERLGADDFERLEEMVAGGYVPADDDEMFIVDPVNRRIKKVSIQEELKKYPPQPA